LLEYEEEPCVDEEGACFSERMMIRWLVVEVLTAMMVTLSSPRNSLGRGVFTSTDIIFTVGYDELLIPPLSLMTLEQGPVDLDDHDHNDLECWRLPTFLAALSLFLHV
jgi:hypothetical protein